MTDAILVPPTERVARDDGSLREVPTCWYTARFRKPPLRTLDDSPHGGREVFATSWLLVSTLPGVSEDGKPLPGLVSRYVGMRIRAGSWFLARAEALRATGLEVGELAWDES